MTSIATNQSLAYRFREIAEKAIAIALAKKIHIESEAEYKEKGIHNHWRFVENLGMSNPPGVAVMNKDGTTTLIRWPTDKEMKDITPKAKNLFAVELERDGFRYTYVIRTKS